MFRRPRQSTAILCCIHVMCLCCGAIRADEPAREHLLLGFEPDEITRMTSVLAKEKRQVKRTTSKSSDGVEEVIVGMSPWAGFRKWALRRGKASQGEWAMAMRPTTLSVWTGPRPGPKLNEVDRFYGLYERSDGIFNIAGVLRKVVLEDWSRFDRLRFDVLVKGSSQIVHIAMEDEDIVPPVVRSVRVEPGKWTTVEVDLKAAAEQRGLNSKRMATLRIGFTLPNPKATAKEARRSGERPTALLDNLRLCHHATAARLPLVRDERPHRLPALFKAIVSKPAPVRLPPGKPRPVVNKAARTISDRDPPSPALFRLSVGSRLTTTGDC